MVVFWFSGSKFANRSQSFGRSACGEASRQSHSRDTWHEPRLGKRSENGVRIGIADHRCSALNYGFQNDWKPAAEGRMEGKEKELPSSPPPVQYSTKSNDGYSCYMQILRSLV